MDDIRIGTSGFSYDDWRGYFYPEEIRKVDMLRYYASRFDAVEINSSYYNIPSPDTFARMADKTPDRFEFVVKAFKDITHSPDADISVFHDFISSIYPLRESGKLGCVLAQYPWGFKKSSVNMERLHQLREEFGDIPVVVEFRNFSWVGEDTYDLMRSLNLGFCCIDEPMIRGLMPRVAIATSRIGYVRFHGRNAEKWWDHNEGWERYDYLYSETELSEWIPMVADICTETEKTYVFFNNHYHGKSAQNAHLFARMLDVPAD